RRRHGAIVQRERGLASPHRGLLVLSCLLAYSWHGWCPRDGVEILGGIHTLVPRHHLLFNYDWDSPLAIYCTYLCHSHASIRWSLLGLHRRVIAGSVATQGSFPRADLERCVKSWESSSRGWGAAAPRCGPGGTV